MQKIWKVVFIAVIIGIATVAIVINQRYERPAMVVAVDNGITSFEDEQGTIWEYYTEGYNLGEEVTLIMNDNETIGIQDDFIIKIK